MDKKSVNQKIGGILLFFSILMIPFVGHVVMDKGINTLFLLNLDELVACIGVLIYTYHNDDLIKVRKDAYYTTFGTLAVILVDLFFQNSEFGKTIDMYTFHKMQSFYIMFVSFTIWKWILFRQLLKMEQLKERRNSKVRKNKK